MYAYLFQCRGGERIRKRDWETEAQIYYRLLAGQTQAEIARYLSKKRNICFKSAKVIVNRKVKRMLKNKILAIEIRSDVNFYVKSVASEHFEKIIQEMGIAPIPGVLSPKRSPTTPRKPTILRSGDIPPLDYFSGDAVRIHQLQYKAKLKGALNSVDDLPKLYHLKWRETGRTRGGTRHFWAELYLKDFEDWAKLHVTKSPEGELTLQLFLPAHYVPIELLEGNYEDYYFTRAYEIARIFTKAGFSFIDMEQIGKIHTAFRAPILDKYELHGKVQVTENVIADQSPGPHKTEIETEDPDGIPELKTIQQIYRALPDIIEAMRTIPQLKREVEELRSALTYQQETKPPRGMYQ